MTRSGQNSTSVDDVRTQINLLGHSGFGVTELRVFDPRPMVAYAETADEAVDLVCQVEVRVSGIYMGVQPRPAHLFDRAPNCWTHAISGPRSNCACDVDIEYITALFFDVDVVSDERAKGCPASEKELDVTLKVAQSLGRKDGLAMAATICCSGNGHYVLAPIVPISVGGHEVAAQLKYFCSQMAAGSPMRVVGTRIDPVYNLSRVMRVMGTLNRKGQALPGRPHRRAHFVTEPVLAQSVVLHYAILNTEVPSVPLSKELSAGSIRCDLNKIEGCEFIRWCRQKPTEVTEPLWFALITNMARLEGGPGLAHEISCLDPYRYDHQTTETLIQRVIEREYSPASCLTLKALGFHCRRLGRCHARAPMYLTDLFSIWKG